MSSLLGLALLMLQGCGTDGGGATNNSGTAAPVSLDSLSHLQACALAKISGLAATQGCTTDSGGIIDTGLPPSTDSVSKHKACWYRNLGGTTGLVAPEGCDIDSGTLIDTRFPVTTDSVSNHQTCSFRELAGTNALLGNLACLEKTYITVKIGSAIWMAENLKVGNTIPAARFAANRSNDSRLEKGCYADVDSSCDSRGGVYQWAEAMALPAECNDISCQQRISPSNHQGICPDGWHIPSNADFHSLATTLGESEIAGRKMKLGETKNAAWDDPRQNDGNSSNFSAMPTGYWDFTAGWANGATHALFWTDLEPIQTLAIAHTLGYQRSNLYEASVAKRAALSVRCVMN